MQSNPDPNPTSKDIQQLLQLADTSGDGLIDYREFVMGLLCVPMDAE